MNVSPLFTRCADAGALAAAGADAIAAAAARATAARGEFRLALSGGSSPAATYRELATRPVDWARVRVWFSDERCVPPDDPASNHGRARDALLAHVPIASEHVHRMPGELPPADGAARYEAALRAAWADSDHTFDLCLLGLGADGHCASLFPGSPALDERERWVVPATAPPGAEPRARLTLTFPCIAASTEVLFLVAGADKAPVLRALARLSGQEFPAARVRARDRVRYLASAEAWDAPDV